MKKIEMYIVETQPRLGNGFKIVPGVDVNYVPIKTNFKEGWGLPVHHKKIVSHKLAMVDVFELGDRVTAELKRGTRSDEDGIVSGGQWVTKTGTVNSVNPYSETHGFILFDDGDRQSISLIKGDVGFPGRNIQSLKSLL